MLYFKYHYKIKGELIMPYIDVNISKKLSDDEKDVLKAKLGELI